MQAFVDAIRKPRGGNNPAGKRLNLNKTASTRAGSQVTLGPRIFSPTPRNSFTLHHLSASPEIVSVQTASFWNLWYFHVPNFVLAVVMYTMLGRALLGLFVEHDSRNYIWRGFCAITGSVSQSVLDGDAESDCARGAMAVRFRLVVLAARPAAGRSSSRSASCAWVQHERAQFYYIGIAFFGMINGISIRCSSSSSSCRFS